MMVDMFKRLGGIQQRLFDRVTSTPPPGGQPCLCPDMKSVKVDNFCPLYDDDGLANGFPHCRTCHLSFGAEDVMGRHHGTNPEHRIGFMCGGHDRFEVLAVPRPWLAITEQPRMPSAIEQQFKRWARKR